MPGRFFLGYRWRAPDGRSGRVWTHRAECERDAIRIGMMQQREMVPPASGELRAVLVRVLEHAGWRIDAVFP